MVRFHPASLAVGAVVAAAVFVCMSQIVAPAAFPSGRFQFGPHPRDFVRIDEGAPYTVPPGKVLILTAVGRPRLQGNQPAIVSVNGQVIAGAAPTLNTSAPCSMKSIPRFAVAHASDVVASFGNQPQPSARVLGFLVGEASSVALGTLRPGLELQPHPQYAFAILEGSPFVVPPGMCCVVTGLGVPNPQLGQQISTRLIANGQDEVQALSGDDSGVGLVSLPEGFVYPPGSVLEVDANDPTFTGRALCYLAAQ